MKELKEFRLQRSVKDVKLAGVVAGIAEDWKVDTALLRMIYAISTIFFPPLAIVYIVAAIIIPKKEEEKND